MGRGVRMACERCDYQAVLYEETPQADLAAPESAAVPTAGMLAASGSFLCPQCVEPVRMPSTTTSSSGSGPTADSRAPSDEAEPPSAPGCPRCGAPLLDFESAAVELAAASRSRTTLDLRAERDGRDQLILLLHRAAILDESVSAGTLSTADARSSLLDAAAEQTTAAAHVSHPWAPLNDTTALAGLPAALATAPDLTVCLELMRDRLVQTDRHISSLEQCVDDEAELPGVPCPRCGTSHLLHWPIWM